MNIKLVLATVCLLGLLFSVKAKSTEEKCECDLAKCVAPTFCPAGVVRDKCNCCDVCGLEEGQLCNYSPSKTGLVWHGFCGTGMECTKRSDIDKSKVKQQSICTCEKKGLVCGSDDVTYSYCQLWAAQYREPELKISYKGPCMTNPIIKTLTQPQTVNEGDKITLMCEVEGYPLPQMEWLFRSAADKTTVRMPSFDELVSTSERGGPQENRITSYLQIINFQRNHEGSYVCLAHGKEKLTQNETSLVFGKASTKKDL